MNFALFIANRYLRSKRKTGFISLITYISAGGVTIGVAALVITLSVMNGFESEVRDRIIGADAHIKVTMFHEMPMPDWKGAIDSLKLIRAITGVTPYVQSKGMLRSGQQIEGVIVKGVDEKTVGNVSDLPKTIIAGNLSLNANIENPTTIPKTSIDKDFIPVVPPALTHRTQSDLEGIIIGRQLSFRLGTTVGDTVILISPSGITSMFSSPRLKRFTVNGIFETGIYEYDDAFAYISLEAAQDIFEMGASVTGIELKLNHLDNADRVARNIEEILRYPYFPRTWHDMHRTLFRWMKIEKWLYTILLSLIIIVAAFNIVSSQIMIVLEKRRDIGILKAMGATQSVIMRIFMFEGLIVGIIGTITGLILGWGLCKAQQTYKFFSLPGDVYFLDSLPVRMQLFDFLIVALVALGLTLLATIYPARRAARLNPVDAIRYE